MEISLDRLTTARETLVRIVKERNDGRKYVPFVLRLEREIAERADLVDDYQRVLEEAAR